MIIHQFVVRMFLFKLDKLKGCSCHDLGYILYPSSVLPVWRVDACVCDKSGSTLMIIHQFVVRMFLFTFR